MKPKRRQMTRTLASGALALTLVTPAVAQVAVGVGVGTPAYHRHWCYNHPGACRGPAGAYARAPGVAVGVGAPGVAVGVGVPAVGVYVAGRGYWDGHGWYAHRYWYHGGWRYR